MLYTSAVFGSAALVLSAAASLPSIQQGARAVYFQTNKSPNQIAAVNVNANGTLGNYVLRATGGNGGGETDFHNLGSQHSVVVYEDYLFVSNSESNDISLFSIAPRNPTSLSLVGTYPVNGGFPNTMAIKEDLICVGYAGFPSGVSCAGWSSHGVGNFDALREFNLNQSNPPNSTLVLVSDVLFTKNESSLLLTAHGSREIPGFLASYEVGLGGKVSQQGSITAPAGVNASFSLAVIPETTLVLASDPELGGWILDIDALAKPVAKIAVPGQKAVCWSGLTHKSGSGIFPDAATNTITQIDIPSGKIIQQWTSTNGNKGQLDFGIDANDRVFLLAFSQQDSLARVVSVDASGTVFSEIDNLVVQGTNGTFKSFGGMAIYS